MHWLSGEQTREHLLDLITQILIQGQNTKAIVSECTEPQASRVMLYYVCKFKWKAQKRNGEMRHYRAMSSLLSPKLLPFWPRTSQSKCEYTLRGTRYTFSRSSFSSVCVANVHELTRIIHQPTRATGVAQKFELNAFFVLKTHYSLIYNRQGLEFCVCVCVWVCWLSVEESFYK